MKKVIYFILTILCLTPILTGCADTITSTFTSTSKEEPTAPSRFTTIWLDDRTTVLIDGKTNVQYLKVVRNISVDGGVAITPIVQKDGKPFVGNTVKKNRFKTEEVDDRTMILTDTETGVEYLRVVRNISLDGGISIIPLLNSDGTFLTNPSK